MLGIAAVVRVGAEFVTFVAVHLAPGSESASRRKEQVKAVIKAVPEADGARVVLGDMNVRDDEVEAWRGRFAFEEALYTGFS